jgi:hypothetical protein
MAPRKASNYMYDRPDGRLVTDRPALLELELPRRQRPREAIELRHDQRVAATGVPVE